MPEAAPRSARRRRRYEKRRRMHPALRVAIWAGAALALFGLYLLATGTRVLPDPRYSRKAQLETMRALNDRLEELESERPPEDLLYGPEGDAWEIRVVSVVAQMGEVVVDIQETKAHINAEEDDLIKEIARSYEILERMMTPEAWEEVRRRAYWESLRPR